MAIYILIGLIVIAIVFKAVEYNRSKPINKTAKQQSTNQQATPKKNIPWRPAVAGIWSVAGTVVTLFLLTLFLTGVLSKPVFKNLIFNSLVSNPIFWAFPVILLIFYVFFRLSDILPINFFRGLTLFIVITFIPLIAYTTYKGMDTKPADTPPTAEAGLSQEKTADTNPFKKELYLPAGWSTQRNIIPMNKERIIITGISESALQQIKIQLGCSKAFHVTIGTYHDQTVGIFNFNEGNRYSSCISIYSPVAQKITLLRHT